MCFTQLSLSVENCFAVKMFSNKQYCIHNSERKKFLRDSGPNGMAVYDKYDILCRPL